MTVIAFNLSSYRLWCSVSLLLKILTFAKVLVRRYETMKHVARLLKPEDGFKQFMMLLKQENGVPPLKTEFLILKTGAKTVNAYGKLLHC